MSIGDEGDDDDTRCAEDGGVPAHTMCGERGVADGGGGGAASCGGVDESVEGEECVGGEFITAEGGKRVRFSIAEGGKWRVVVLAAAGAPDAEGAENRTVV